MPERFGPHEEELPTEANRDIDLWKDSDLTQKIDRQKELGIYPPHVLITDRDGTHSMFGWAFKGTDEELEHYNTETARLNEHLESRGTVLIMNTGGSIEMMESGLADGTIPADAALVAGGSELFIVKNGAYVKVESYQKYIEDVIGYRREAVYPACQELVTTLNATDQAD